MAWLSGWANRKTVSITGQTGAGTNYQVDFSIGDGSGGDFHLESHCTSFPNDIQVTDNDQTTPLDYWVEDLTLDPITMWVEVADDLGSNVDICVYYGKSGASTESDIDTTFIFGDDFSGAYPGTKWTGDTGSGSVSGGILTFGSGTAGSKYIYSDQTGGTNTAIRSRFKVSAFTTLYAGGGYANSGGTDNIHLVPSYNGPTVDGYSQYTKAGVSSAIQDLTLTSAQVLNYALWEIQRHSTTTVKITRDGTTEKDYSDTTYIPTIAVNADFLRGTSTGVTIIADWIVIRKYQTTEPAFSSAGSEEVGAVTYYFNSKSTSVWTNSEKMIDNILTNYAYTSSDGAIEVLDGNTCPGTDLGTITKVEIIAYGYGDGDDRIDLTPVFSGSEGDEHQTTPGGSPGSWGLYQDITSDTNHPSPWTWSAVQTLDCKVEKDSVAKANVMYCAKVEIRVTYTQPGEGATRSYGFIFG